MYSTKLNLNLRKIALALALSLGLLTCGTFSVTYAADIDPRAKALVKLDDEWSAAAVKRDVERVASFYAEDAVAYPPNEKVAVGRAAAKKVWAAYLADPTYKISWHAEHALIAESGELGVTSGVYEDSYVGANGNVVAGKGKFLCTWKKQKDGSWKAIHDMWNPDTK